MLRQLKMHNTANLRKGQIAKKLHYILFSASTMCFIGHGVFGIITKPIWANYFGVFNIGRATAFTLMPWIGVIDILLGISLLLYPTRAILLWLVVWGTLTALLRPLSGEPFAEFLERAGNYGVPLVLLLIHQMANKKPGHWFNRLKPVVLINEPLRIKITAMLQIIVILFFVGHGWLNIIEKKGLLNQYKILGFSNQVAVAHLVGVFEILAAVIVMIRPSVTVVMLLLIWKITTEMLYPQMVALEWIERGGSYGSLLALWVILTHKSSLIYNTSTTMSVKYLGRYQ
ncbi:hypothetical protein [Mucilaginibacter sp. UYCu711]|uniref:hypothetical protein n=1 Tax=Mucilaginibacter sp. UYCu711 TaxID=3156339 RepID=UPI003D208D12